jgi:hypothetical protein
MTSHWPTMVDDHIACRCGKRFPDEQEWQQHVARRVVADYLDRPSESSSGHAAPSR